MGGVFRLKKTGVVDVKNPVEQALHEGRLESRLEEIEED